MTPEDRLREVTKHLQAQRDAAKAPLEPEQATEPVTAAVQPPSAQQPSPSPESTAVVR